MDFTFLKILGSRREVRTLVLYTFVGGAVQILCRRYLKDHPENFEEKNGNLKEAKPEIKNKNRNPRLRNFFPRGEAMIELSGLNIKIIAKVAMSFLANQGLWIGVTAGSGIILSKIPLSVISKCLNDSLPQNLPHLEKTKFILDDGKKVYLTECDPNLKYLFKTLSDRTMSFKEKEEIARSVLTKYLDLKTAKGRINFVLCIVSILYIFSELQDMSTYHIILKNLIKAIKEGRISKKIGRLIVRRLQRQGLLIDPELLEIINS